MEDLPPGLSAERNILLEGRNRHPWYRRGLMALVCVLPVLALLNVFGQDPSSSSASGSEGTLKIQAPKHVRGGLLFQLRVDVTATTDIEEPQLVLSPGWMQELTTNAIEPQPNDESSSNGRVTLSYDRINAGQKLTVWLAYQVNPVTAGTRTANVELTDGDKPVAIVHRKLTIFP